MPSALAVLPSANYLTYFGWCRRCDLACGFNTYDVEQGPGECARALADGATCAEIFAAGMPFEGMCVATRTAVLLVCLAATNCCVRMCAGAILSAATARPTTPPPAIPLQLCASSRTSPSCKAQTSSR